jgi:hypothetical protein
MMVLRRSVIKTDSVSYLLAANSYIAITLSTPLFLDISFNSIYGQLHPDSSFDDWRCRFKSYVLYIHGCVYFFSFFLQSIYRFCRIVYPRRVILHSFRPYVILSIGLWFLAAALLMPSVFLGDIDYLPHDYHCQLPPSNLRGMLRALSSVFLIPFILTLICYFYTMHYVRTQTTALTTINQHRSIRRDLIIMSRLVLLFVFVTAAALPHVLIPIIYTITGYLPTWVASFEWSLTVFSFTAASIIQLFVTPHLKKLCVRATPMHHMARLNIAERRLL